MKISIFFAVLLLASIGFAQPSPTTLNIDPDKEIQVETVNKINATCRKKILTQAFENLTGETCTELKPERLLKLAEALQSMKDVKLVSGDGVAGFKKDDISGLELSCSRKVLKTDHNSVNTIIFLNGGTYADYSMAYVLRYDPSTNRPDPLTMVNVTSLFAHIEVTKVPRLWFQPSTTLQKRYDDLENEITFYAAKDLIITAPNNVTYFWQNIKSRRDVESLPISRALAISCIEEELAKLP